MNNVCLGRGWLVNAERFIPTQPFDFQFQTLRVSVGCSRLICDHCNTQVKNRAGFFGRAKLYEVVEALYGAADWQPFLAGGVLVPRAAARLYYCKCHFHSEETEHNLLGDEDGFMPDPMWHCAGHPLVELPLVEEGLTLSESTDWLDLLADYYSDRLASNPSVAVWDIDWVHRIYQVMPAAVRRDVATAAWQLIERLDNLVAVRATGLFALNPEAVPVERLVRLFRELRAELHAVASALAGGQTLRYWLLSPVATRLRLAVEPSLLALAQSEVLSPDVVPDNLIGALEHVAPTWIDQHRSVLVARYPALRVIVTP